MRIAFLGKGGSGKTTTAAGFVRYAAKKHRAVLAIDADVNSHMLHALNLKGCPKVLGDGFDQIANYVRGSRTDLNERPMISTTPPSLSSNFISASVDDPIISAYALQFENIALLTVGPYKESDIGGSCYHSKLASLEIFLHHLLDTENDILIADTTAGTDNVATSLNSAYDLNIFIVEPTEKSICVYNDFIKVAPHLAKRTFVVANKVEGDEDKLFIANRISNEKIIGYIPLSRNLKRFEQGEKDGLALFQVEQAQVFDAIYKILAKTKRDWNDYLIYLRQAHEKVCKEWWNSYYSADLADNLDESFNYQTVIEKKLSGVDANRQLASAGG